MKILIASLTALAMTASALSCLSVSAEEDTGSDHISKTVTIGDINNSGKLDVGDLVTAGRFILGEDVEGFSSLLFDVNIDGENDIFDLIELRKLVIDPDNSKIQTYAMDMLKSVKEIKFDDIKFDNYEDAEAYFQEMLSSNEEIKKFTELYDEEFFKENDLILRPFIQENDEKILYDFANDIYNNAEKILQIKLDDEDAAENLSKQFGSVLAQVTVPKEMTDLIEELDLAPLTAAAFPFDDLEIDLAALDEETELDIKNLTDYINSIMNADWSYYENLNNDFEWSDFDELFGESPWGQIDLSDIDLDFEF